MNYTLAATSPLVTDERVRKAQRVLNGHNVFGQDFLEGAVDGQFGSGTSLACIHAKDWIGYADKDLHPTYGPMLDDLLRGKVLIPDEFKKRQKARQKRKTNVRAKALEEAKKHLGVKESPAGSNKVLFSRWYGITGPWCAMFVSYCYVQAKSKSFVKGQHYAYVPYIVADARAGRNGLRVTNSPLPGDVVCYDWDGGVADHVGIFEKGSASSFEAIEGNTAVGNDSNGGEVMRRNRSGSQVEAFVRVTR